MPIYNFEHCDTAWEGYLPLTSSEPPACAKCGDRMERVWKPTKTWASTVFPYTTSHINGKPIEIRSEAHLHQVCRENGVVSRPDASFIEGRGSRGSWF